MASRNASVLCEEGALEVQTSSGEPKYNQDAFENTRDSKQPKVPSQEQTKDVEKIISETVILLHTVKVEEMVAVYDLLQAPSGFKSTILLHTSTGIELTLGMFGSHKAALVRTSKGGDCRHEITKALKSLSQVQLILAVGFAYGRKDKCKLGDVLVSNFVDGVSNIRVDKTGEIKIDEGDVRYTSMSTETRAVFTKRNWIDFVCTSDGKRKSQVYCGVLISAPILVNNESALQKLVDRHERFLGGEMEGQELAQLTDPKKGEFPNVHFIVIKGVADFGDGRKEKNWQFTASLAAATYADLRLKDTTFFCLKDESQGIPAH